MIYGTFKDNVLESIGCSDELPSSAVEFPDGFAGVVGMHRDEFDSAWVIKPLSARVASGLVSIPSGYKLDGEDVVPMSLSEKVTAGLVIVASSQVLDTAHGTPYIRDKTPNERIRDKLDSRPKGYKLVEDTTAFDGLSLTPLTLTEQVTMGDIAQATADTIQALNMRYERTARYAPGDDAIADLNRKLRAAKTAGTDTSDITASIAKWDSYNQALADVPEQVGFPWSITWPTRPDGVSA